MDSSDTFVSSVDSTTLTLLADIEALCGDTGNKLATQRATYPVGQSPFDSTAADFNADGNPDLAVANADSNNVSILLGKADGTFQNAVNYPTGIDPETIRSGDFNKDGKIDLVTANENSQTGAAKISLLLGNGNGTFQAPANVAPALTEAASAVEVGDFNKDAKPDLVIGSDKTYVLLGNGNGTFQAPLTVASGITFSVAVANFNADNNPDIVTNNVLILGNGNGTFQAAQPFLTERQLSLVRTADVNGDGKADVVAASTASNTAGVALGNGNGTFQPAKFYVAGKTPLEIAIADVDADGKPDLTVSNSSDDHLSILINQGNGSFRGAPHYLNPLFNRPSSPVLARFNADNRLDVAVGGFPAQLFLQNTDGSFAAPISIGAPAEQLATGDFNKDNKADLALVKRGVSVSDPGTLTILPGNGAGGFGAQTQQLPLAASVTFAVRATDLDKNGALDLVVAQTDKNSLAVFLGNGNGTFQTKPVIAVGVSPSTIAEGDFNGDGKLDLAVSNQGDFSGTPKGSLSILLGKGDGTFQPVVKLLSGNNVLSVAAGRLDADNRIDLAAFVDSPITNIVTLRGNGNGTFQAPVNAPKPADLFPGAPIAVADVNSDGAADLVVGVDDSKIGVFAGNGNGIFQPSVSFDAGNFASGIAIGNLNQDPQPDVVVTAGGGITVLINAGDFFSDGFE